MMKLNITHQFSKAADTYDQFSTLQNHIGHDLISLFPKTISGNLLEIGSGTGSFTQFIHQTYPKKKITCIDPSKEMIHEAQKKQPLSTIKFKQSSIEQFKSTTYYGGIFSNASLQWVEHFGEVLEKIKTLMNKEGFFIFSILGPQTMGELRNCLSKFFRQSVFLSSSFFLSGESLYEQLSQHFEFFSITEKKILVPFKDSLSLLKTIHYTGTRGRGLPNNHFWTPGTLRQLDSLFKTYFGRVEVTYQVFFITCRS